jgi:predicted membrane channel-forming protein YqfA (hemolysin III family)
LAIHLQFFEGTFPAWVHWVGAGVGLCAAVALAIVGVVSVAAGPLGVGVIGIGAGALFVAFTALQVHYARRND